MTSLGFGRFFLNSQFLSFRIATPQIPHNEAVKATNPHVDFIISTIKLDNPDLQYLLQGPKLDITVGTGTAARRWKLPKALLCYYSSYFAGACRSGCKEALTGQFNLSEDDPEIFALFVEWLCAADTETPVYTPHVPGAFEPGRWHSDPELGWMLADRLLCPSFEKFALAKVIQNLDTITFARLEWINENVWPGSSLWRLCAHWVSWSGSGLLLPRLQTLEFDMFFEKRDGTILPRLRRYVDPRRMDLEHWFNKCSRVVLNCEHLPRRPTKG